MGTTIQSVATGTIEDVEKKQCEIGVEVTGFGYSVFSSSHV